MLSPSRALGGQNSNAHRMSRSRDDQVARDRQMQQDIDSAMSMCESTIHRSRHVLLYEAGLAISRMKPKSCTFHIPFTDDDI